MIQVNLLPAEMRKPEGTPMARFMIIIGDVVVISFAVILFFWLNSVRLPAAEKKHQEVADKVRLAKVKADKYDKLEQAKRSFEQRKNTFEQLSGERVLWSKKLAQLSKIVGAQPAWLANLKVSSTKGVRGGTAHKITTMVWIAGRDERKATAFRKALRADKEYWKDFSRMTEPGLALSTMKFTRKDGDQTRVYKEEQFFTFNLEQLMKEVGLPEPKQPRVK